MSNLTEVVNAQAEEMVRMRKLTRELSTENERLRKALQEIDRFGHNEGHGRGYTCANMATAALEGKC
jgi:hypothetical protein